MLKGILRALAATALLGLVCGCSGGSGAEFTISEQNAEQVAGQGVDASNFIEGMSDIVEQYVPLIEDPAAQVVLCEDGNVLLNVNDVGAQGVVSTGDSVSITFQACDVGFGVVFNGTVSFTATDVTGEAPGPYSRVLDVSISSFSITVGNAAIVVNGAFTLEESSADGVTIVRSASGASLSAYAQGGGEAFSGTVSNFVFESAVNTETGAYTITLQATVSGSELGGTVTFETTTPFTGTGEDAPEAGTFYIEASNGSNATLVALGANAVQILIDRDGDQEIEITINTTWDVINDEDRSESEL